MQIAWDMMSDSKIWEMLGDIDHTIDEDFARLMFIELFSRVKVLEEENIALRVLLMEENVLQKELFDVTLKAVRDFLREKDRERAAESKFFANSGVSFPEWVSFKLTGKFKKSGTESNLQ